MIIKLYPPVFIFLLLVLFVSSKTDIPIEVFIKDPALIAGQNGLSPLINASTNPFVGVVSNIGVLLWCISASICLFSFTLLKKQQNLSRNRRNYLAPFLLFSGLITSFLLLDDLFLIHESIIPKLLKLPQVLIYSCYVAVIFFWIIKFRRTIMNTEWGILLLAFIFFGVSVFMDILMDESLLSSDLMGNYDDVYSLIEDACKLFGILSWLAYFARVCFQAMNNATGIDSNAGSQKSNVLLR